MRVAARRAIAGRNRSRTDPTAGRFTREQVTELAEVAFERLEGHVPGLPSEPTVGSRQKVTLAAPTLSFLEAPERDGIERRYAIELTCDVCWHFYRQWAYLTSIVTRLITRDPVAGCVPVLTPS
ncbi:MAG: hypothetical protein M3Y09_21275 [Actinomycetota bacterium]|nr:hypothetical protein [Actinomycetota bacterium]